MIKQSFGRFITNRKWIAVRQNDKKTKSTLNNKPKTKTNQTPEAINIWVNGVLERVIFRTVSDVVCTVPCTV